MPLTAIKSVISPSSFNMPWRESQNRMTATRLTARHRKKSMKEPMGTDTRNKKKYSNPWYTLQAM